MNGQIDEIRCVKQKFELTEFCKDGVTRANVSFHNR